MAAAVVAVVEVVAAVAVEVVVVAVAAAGIKLHYGTAAGSIEQPVHC
jgi:hypothetical protein